MKKIPEVYLKGSSIIGTINSLDDYGDFATKALKKLKISKFIPDKFYPFKIRSEIFDLVMQVYDVEGLYYAGFKNTEYWYENLIDWKKTINDAKQKYSKIVNTSKVIDIISNELILGIANTGIKSSTKGSEDYGAKIIKNDNSKIECILTTANKITHWPFMAGNLIFVMHAIFSKKIRF